MERIVVIMQNTIVRTNVLSMNAHRNMGMVSNKLARSSARLSSGYRINSSADDAAGLAVSEKMRAQIRGLDQASRNSQDGISLLTVMEGGMNSITDMIIRKRELTIQALNDTNTLDDRQAIQLEINQLLDEMYDTSNRLEFNTMSLLNVPREPVTTWVPGQPINMVIPGNPGANAINTPNHGHVYLQEGDSITIFIGGVINTGSNFPDMVLVDPNGNLFGWGSNQFFNSFGGGGGSATITYGQSGPYGPGGSLITSGNTFNSADSITYSGYSLGAVPGPAGTAGAQEWFTINNVSAAAAGRWYFRIVNGGSAPTEFWINSTHLEREIVVYGQETDGHYDTTSNALHLQIGANTGNSMFIKRYDLRPIAQELAGISVLSVAQGLNALERLDRALGRITSYRAIIGSEINRLEFAILNVNLTSENLSDSKSRIRDADMSREMMHYTKANVLQQASTTMLAQANQSPQAVLQLLA